MRERRIIISILVISLFIAMAVGAGPQVVMWYRETQGDVFGTSPDALVERIMRENLDPKLCFKFRYPIPALGLAPAPTVGEQRTTCVYLVAQQLKDPTACLLLMPSEYGLFCVGSIWGPISDETNCHWYQSNSVRCFEGEKLIPRVTLCEESTAKNLPDECWHRMAFKKKDPAICKEIQNPVLRSVCEVCINTWNKSPEVRSTIYFSMP